MITRTDAFLAHARARAEAAHAAAEAADTPNARAAWRAAAATWERIAGPGTPWSTKLLSSELADLKRAVVSARGPFQPPQPPKAPSPAKVGGPDVLGALLAANPKTRDTIRPQEATIEF